MSVPIILESVPKRNRNQLFWNNVIGTGGIGNVQIRELDVKL